MCGIAGIIGQTGITPPNEALLTRMGDRLAHRGPDASNVWISRNRRAGFAHRRLAIIDLSDNADQPMIDASGTACLVFNGEIYNHLSLRAELVAKGSVFQTDHSDTEVLLQGYLAWGMDGLLQRLNGIFAFALRDESRKLTWLVRDRLGVKPLYFGDRDGSIYFASEIKALLVQGALPARPDPVGIWHYLNFMAPPAPFTMFAGIRKLPAGVLAEFHDGEAATFRRYWDCVPSADLTRPIGATVSSVRELVERAVSRQMMTDVPAGIFLSGGVDSTAILALGTRQGPLDAFTVSYQGDVAYNEAESAAAMAKQFGARHHIISVGSAATANYLRQLVVDQDEPLADWVCVPLHFLADAAKASGVKMVLVGEGADEIFCGYPLYQRFLNLRNGPWRIARLMAAAGLSGIAAAYYRRSPGNLGHAVRADFFARAQAGRECFPGAAIAFGDTLRNSVAGDRLRQPLAEARASGADDFGMPNSTDGDVIEAIMRPLSRSGADTLGRMTYLELKFRLAELLLMRVDKITMASSIEARVPFLDHELVEFMMTVPQEQKLHGGELKYLLKAAMRGIVPDQVLNGPKRGFGVPISAWMRGPLGRRCHDEIMSSSLVADGWIDRAAMNRLFAQHLAGDDTAVLLWTVYNLAAWHQHWFAQ